MGGSEGKLKEQFLFAIMANKEGKVNEFLSVRNNEAINLIQKYPEYVNTTLLNGTTNPMCRAGYLGHTNVVSLLLKFNGDINLRSSDGRTALMWAAFRNNGKMCDFLLHNNADINLVDNAGWNALDISIIKMNYESAIVLKRNGIVPQDIETYQAHVWRKYDIGMFI